MRRSIAIAFPLVCVMLLFVGSASAGLNTWTGTGPTGGAIRAVLVDPSAPSTIYIGTVGSGVFKSTDGGATWFPSEPAGPLGDAHGAVTRLRSSGHDLRRRRHRRRLGERRVPEHRRRRDLDPDRHRGAQPHEQEGAGAGVGRHEPLRGDAGRDGREPGRRSSPVVCSSGTGRRGRRSIPACRTSPPAGCRRWRSTPGRAHLWSTRGLRAKGCSRASTEARTGPGSTTLPTRASGPTVSSNPRSWPSRWTRPSRSQGPTGAILYAGATGNIGTTGCGPTPAQGGQGAGFFRLRPVRRALHRDQYLGLGTAGWEEHSRLCCRRRVSSRVWAIVIETTASPTRLFIGTDHRRVHEQ